MKILTVDVGTGTQDIYLYNSQLDMENNFKLVVPSPTMILRQAIRQSTSRGEDILLSGVTMGGGPCAWAAEDHLKAGYAVYATPDAARTLNDDLDKVRSLGVQVVSDEEARRLPKTVRRLVMKDFDFDAIARAFTGFGISLQQLDGLAVGVFDHGNAPPEISDRTFRFDYLDERIRRFNRLSAFAYRAEDVPPSMTRLQCVVASAGGVDCPLVVMDTAPAAVLGASLDPRVAGKEQALIANIGNFHTLAFRLGRHGIEGMFEHHTGFLDQQKLTHLLGGLASGSLRGEDVFNDQGHGALVYDATPLTLGTGDFDVVVTGPRRSLLPPGSAGTDSSSLRAYYPAPFGDMMITGCFGLLAAIPDVMPELGEPVRESLQAGAKTGAPPWEVDQD